jgi:hypothetical protein
MSWKIGVSISRCLSILFIMGFAASPARSAEIGYTVWVCPPDVSCALPIGTDQPAVPTAAVVSDVDEIPLVATGSAIVGNANIDVRFASASVMVAAGAPVPPKIGVNARFADVADGSALAFAFWEDELTLNVLGSPIGTLFTITATYRIDGSLQVYDDFLTGGQSAEWTTAISVNGNGLGGGGGFCQRPFFGTGDPDCLGADYTGTPLAPPGNTVSSSFQVANGIEFVQRLAAWTNLSGYLLRGEADLGSTIDWVSFEVRDASDELITNFTLESVSGIDWTLPSSPPASVPSMHPAALYALLPSLLIGLGLRASRTRHPRRQK